MTTTPPLNHGPLLPVVALVLSVVGLCVPPLLLVSLGLGIYGFQRAKKDTAWAPRKQLTQMTMAVSGAGLAIFLGMLLPQLKAGALRMKQVPCREGLSTLYLQQQELKRSNGRYTTLVSELAKLPPSGPQLYRLAGEGPLLGSDAVGIAATAPGIDEGLPSLVRDMVGLKDGQVTMLCASQLDADATIDVWMVSTAEHTGNNGERIPAGLPWLEVDDVTR